MPRTRTELKCDFCGRDAARVRRVALDRGYDRLGPNHVVRYACEECSAAKDAGRSLASQVAAATVDGPPKPL